MNFEERRRLHGRKHRQLDIRESRAMSGNGSRSGRRIAYRRDDTIRRDMTAVGLPDFETVAQCIERNRQMLRRLQNHVATPTRTRQLVGGLEAFGLLPSGEGSER